MPILKIKDAEGNIQEILAIRGEPGVQGEKGPQGEVGAAGKDGKDGKGITGVHIDDYGELSIEYSSGDTQSAGKVVPKKGEDYYTEEDKDNLLIEITNTITPDDIGAVPTVDLSARVSYSIREELRDGGGELVEAINAVTQAYVDEAILGGAW